MKQPLKGRGAQQQPAPRYLSTARVPWLEDAEVPGAPLDPVPTQVGVDHARSVISRNQSPDIPFTQSINPYRGCEHGCVYCYARPSHAWLDLSPGLDFETRLFYKHDAARRLEEALARPGYLPEPITLGANTDPYQPIEREYRVTRDLLEVLHATRHPVSIITKGTLILRDLDLLAEMATGNRVQVAVSLTTLDNDLKRRLEPRAASPAGRLRVMQALHEARVPVAAMLAPVIPALNEAELERMLEAARDHGAERAGYILLRLPREVAPLFEDWLAVHYPERARHVMSVLRQSRGGAVYDARFGQRMRGTGPFAQLLERRFGAACRRLGLHRGRSRPLDGSAFRPPRRGPQLDLALR